MTWTLPADVKGRWIGPEAFPVADDVLARLIADAEDTATAEFSDIQERIDAATLPLARVQKVVSRVVIRHLRNPKGYRQAMDVTGPFTEQVMYGGNTPGEMYLTDEDRAELGEAKSGRAFTIDTTPPAPIYGTGPEGWLSYGGTWYQ